MDYHFQPSLCAFLDVLGFREVIETAYSEKNERHLLKDISDALNTATEEIKSFGEQTSMASVRFFTDSVIVGYTYWTKEANVELGHLCELLAHYQLTMACKGFFIRGGISIGTLACEGDIVFGDALLKAHRLEAVEAGNPRVILDANLRDSIERNFPSASEIDRNTWKARLMRDVDGYFFVNYLSATYEQRHDPRYGMVLWPSEERIMTHRMQVEQHLNNARPRPKVWAKYFWVANYHNSFCERLGFKHCKVDESLLMAHPISLS